ncbi:MAG: 4a-hydroxytetrahydrobiopterin dehydratase, partial [Candidatus Pacebacteria bacterium]|nr:4a-hydroxytetrahydrobiopterin dehydratase [Candidatus Paceibacterota bacterium]
SEGHHPDLSIGWGKVTVSLMTHAIGGLSENDFILAAKIGAIE